MTITLRLKKREERRLAAGHLWVFSNEIDIAATPLKGIDPGSAVEIESADGKFLAHGYANPHSLIAARVTSRRRYKPFDSATLHERLTRALALRQSRYEQPCYRWVYGEGDWLPGLVVDRMDDLLVVQITTAGMERYREELVAHLVELSGASAVLMRDDAPMRALEQLPQEPRWVHGSAPDTVVIRENGLSFTLPADLGQKTGWFYDHRDSRRALRPWVKDARVLDCYAYAGAFGVNAAVGGAREVLCVDASVAACEAARTNARHNGVDTRMQVECADVPDTLRRLHEDKSAPFDVIVLDPPAFIKRRKDMDAGRRHYDLNHRLAMKLLAPGGILVSASCSQAFDQAMLERSVRQNLPAGSLGMQVLANLRQAADHPVNLSMAETLYLKGVIARLL